MSSAQALGKSSLDALADLGTSEDDEALLHIPVEELHFDPHQPRRDFAADGQVDASDRKALHALAENLKAVGFAQPLRVRPRGEEGGYFVVTGERRLRAARHAELETVPCLLAPEDERPDERLLLQISENLLRKNLKLLDLAQALDDLANRSDRSDQQLAAMLGRSKAWFSSHRRVLRAEGIVREALEEDLVQSAETLRLLQKLPETAQRRLLRSARDSGQAIPRGVAKALLDKLEKKDSRPPEIADPASSGSGVYMLELAEKDLRKLSALLRVEPSEDRDAWIDEVRRRIAELPAAE